jgi:hypothetical protein
MKLRQLLYTKFINKYTAIGGKTEGLEAFVNDELDTMFKGDKFDERDLVKIDRRIRLFLKQGKLDKINAAEVTNNKGVTFPATS